MTAGSIGEAARQIHNAYLPLRHEKVWFPAHAVAFFALLLASQSEAGITGGMIEVGVHNGGSAFLTITALQPGERQILVDVARLPGFNEKFALLPDEKKTQVTYIEMRSDDAIEQIDVTAARFIHIDANHERAFVSRDLKNYAPRLADNGVLSCADFFQAYWPGVTEAIIEVLPQIGIVPFAIVGNKLYACRAPAHDRYVEIVKSMLPHLAIFGEADSTQVRFLATPTLVVRLRTLPAIAVRAI